MGVTISCQKTGRGIDMGYYGLHRLQLKIADLIGDEFSKHYKVLDKPEIQIMSEPEFQTFCEMYDKKTMDFIQRKVCSIKVIDFLYQPVEEGAIRFGACKQLLKVIGDYDDEIIYGYAGQKDAARFKDFKHLLQECVEQKCDMVWI